MSRTSLLSAAKNNDTKAALLALRDGADPDAGNPIGQTGLHVAAIWRSMEVAEVLLKAGANANARNAHGTTPLHFAAKANGLEMCKLLLQYGANKWAQAGNGEMPFERAEEGELRELLGPRESGLHRAIMDYDQAALQRLLDEGGDIREPDPRGRTPVHMAALAAIAQYPSEGPIDESHSSLALLETVVAAAEGGAARAAVNLPDAEGLVALHYLVQFGNCPGAALLLRAGADPDLKSTTKRDDTYRSGQWGKKMADGVEVIRAEADRSPLHLAIESEGPAALSMVSLLLEYRADPNVTDVEGRSALHQALDFDDERSGANLQLAEVLLQHKADPSLGVSGSSCLHIAAGRNDADVLRVLLPHAKSLSAAGKGGFTPLALAARSGALAVVPLLLQAGADPNEPTRAGKSARELAVINKKAKVVEAFDAHAKENAGAK